MTIRDRRALKDAAAEHIQQAAYSPRKLVLIHSGIAFGVALVIALLNYILAWQVDTNTGGLSGMQLRSVLETASAVLRYAQSIAMPFWNIGLIYAMLCIGRGQSARPENLLEGFRRFGPVLRLRLLQGILYGLIAMVCAYISSLLFLLTPFAQPLMEQMESLMTAQTVEQMESLMAQLSYEQMLSDLYPFMGIFLAVYLVVLLPLVYRFRMADYAVMDQPGTGALAALTASSRMMRGNRFQLFRLDLSLWPYYVLSALATVLAYADQLLPALGVTLPISETVAFFGAYVLYVLAMLALNWWLLPRVETTYAVTYDVLRQQAPQPVIVTAPKNVPWDYPEEKEEKDDV